MFLPAHQCPRQQEPGRPPRQGIAARPVKAAVAVGTWLPLALTRAGRGLPCYGQADRFGV